MTGDGWANGPGVPVTIVGYGIDIPFDPALLVQYLMLDPKVRRVGTSRLSALTPDYLRLDPTPAIGCFLDSGSPAFLARSATILGTLQATDCASFAQYVRVTKDPVWEFLEEFLP